MSKNIKILVFSLFAVTALFVFNTNSYAQKSEKADEYEEDAPDEYESDEDYVYKQNGPGDQFLNLRIMPNFPIDFGETMHIGGQITISYNRFVTSWLALGAELAFGYNPTIGNNIFTYIPITVAITFLPNINKFEFPITLNIGVAVENYLSNTYFPGFVIRGGAGCYYRINESWSAGLEGFFTYMPQWYNDSSKNDYLNMASVSAGVKYHF